jgi:hypothetical protein
MSPRRVATSRFIQFQRRNAELEALVAKELTTRYD